MVHQSAKLDFLLDDKMLSQESVTLLPYSVLRETGRWKAREVKPLNLSLNLPQGLKSSALKVCFSFMETVSNGSSEFLLLVATPCCCAHTGCTSPSKNREGQGWEEETSKTALERLWKKPGHLLAWVRPAVPTSKDQLMSREDAEMDLWNTFSTLDFLGNLVWYYCARQSSLPHPEGTKVVGGFSVHPIRTVAQAFFLISLPTPAEDGKESKNGAWCIIIC